ncbi:MAG: tetraacyldisaccharide 4'-kinase [Phycisphaerales bacterium]|nr:tetraacyldisaccharide 4'-kinase [Phycisphaerales bacterium]
MPAILRFIFEILSWFYAVVIGLRNLAFDLRLLKQTKLPIPVISVGNITTGGTGKTPTVIMLVKELQKLGKKPAVLTRGYGARPGQKADEVLVIESECPGVPVVVNPNRVQGGREAIEKYQADVLVMDDGFQHRHLARDLNIVLVDVTEPMGIPGVLPRGTWREPPYNLKRANMIMLTRCEQVSDQLADLAAGLLTEWVSPQAIFQQRTAVVGLHDANDNPIPLIAGGGAEARNVIAFAGIANPRGFLNTVRSLGMRVSAACWFDDHHVYDPTVDFGPMRKLSQSRQIDAWLTTMKDWVKIREQVQSESQMGGEVPIWHVRIESRLRPHDHELLRAQLATLTACKHAG